MSDTITKRGNIKLIDDAQSFPSGFTKREFVITTDDQYPQDLKLELIKDNCSKLDNFNVGDPVNVSLDIRGREHNGNHYVNLVCWRIDASSQDSQQTQQQPAQSQQNATQAPQQPQGGNEPEELDDIPF